MFILASGSPRRKQLLHKLLSDFEIIVPSVDESILNLPAKDLPLEESRMKAYAVFALHPLDQVLACDTVVVLNNQVLGKPKSEQEAFEMLKAEQGKKQVVLSGYTYIDKDFEISRTVKTDVYFRPLSDEQIWEYIRIHKPLDKAGSYGIQDDYPLIDHIEGSFDNVMGLPTEDLAVRLRRILAK